MTPTKRLLDAEQHFTDLAEQLGKLKFAAEAIEKAGSVTGQMSLLAESALSTANSLGAKVDHAVQVLEQQNIPLLLHDYEVRTNLKFQGSTEQVDSLQSELRIFCEIQVQSLERLTQLNGENAESIAFLQQKTDQLQQLAEKSADSTEKYHRIALLFQAAIAAAIAYLILRNVT